MPEIKIYDTTLRDGAQSEDISLTLADRVRIALKLDELGVSYIEGGWPGSNMIDKSFFKEISVYSLKNSLIAAFGSTHHPKNSPDQDSNMAALIESGAQAATIVGKTWDFHVTDALRIKLSENLDIIKSSIAFLKPHFQEVFFDAEHFFDGFIANREHALACLSAAIEAGSAGLILCDTNGGRLPHEIGEITAEVKKNFPNAVLGIHCHNDSSCAVASSLAAVRSGVTQVQGVMNGYGERCGNANLCSIIPNLELKMGLSCLPPGNLSLLTQTAILIDETANLIPDHRQPYVGESAFAHKGGIHVSAVVKNPTTYEHIDPVLVGNKRRILLSDLSGQSNILVKAREFGFDLDRNDPFVLELLTLIKERESKGYSYTAAEASFELLLNQLLGRYRTYFSLISCRVHDDISEKPLPPRSEASVIIKVGGKEEHTAATGQGPVNAIDNALRKALEQFYPKIKEMRLLDMKVRVLSSDTPGFYGTASRVRVLIESGDSNRTWVTVGVSHDIIEASWQALEDSVNYKLFSDDKAKLTKALRDM